MRALGAPPLPEALMGGAGFTVRGTYTPVDGISRVCSRTSGTAPPAPSRASAIDTTSYFRRSAGPGWALPGDAGHFKDPVTAQGIRDALRYGRELGEDAAPVLDDPAALESALRRWARRRERECLSVYRWTNVLGRAEEMTAVEKELYRAAEADPAIANEVLDVFSRVKRPNEVLTLRRGALMTLRALRRPGADRGAVLRAAVQVRA